MSVPGALHGRDAEAAVITALLNGAQAGRSGALVIGGETGIGKTALLEFAAREAVGCTVLRATAIETEAELPFAGLHLLLRPVLSRLSKIPARQAGALARAFGLTPASARQADDVFLAGLAVLSLLTEVADDGPVLCLIDDAQWLDAASTTALLFAARRLDVEAVVMLLALRDGPRQLAADLRQLHLEPLRDDDARRLLHDEADSLEPFLAERVLADAAGNPLAITEFARAVVTVPRTAYHGQPGPLPIGQRLQRLYAQQVSTLPDATRLLLLLAAAAGAGELPLILNAAYSLGLDAAAFGPAEQAGLITVTERALTFCHPLARAAVYHDAPIARRHAVHRALAEVVTAIGAGNLGRRAWHLAAAASGPDDAAAAELELAAEQARQVSGYAAVAAAYERSAELTTDTAARARRLLAAATAASDMGQFARAERLVRVAERLSREPLFQAEVAYIRSRDCAADHGRKLADLAEAAQAIADDHPRRAAWLLRNLAASARHSGQSQLAATVSAGLASLEMKLAAMTSPAEEPEEPPSPHERLVAAIDAWVGGGDHEGALRISADLAAECRERGMANWLAGALHLQSVAQTARGEWTGARVTALEGMRLAADIGQPARAAHAAAVLALLAALTDDEADCMTWLAAYECHDIAHDTWRYGVVVPAIMDLGRGQFESALARFRAGLSKERWQATEAFWYKPEIVEAAARGGDPAWASEASAVFGGWAIGTGQRWARAVAARCEGLADTSGSPERHFREALDWHAGDGRPFESARTRLVYGEWLRREKRRTDAAAQLIGAVEVFDASGAMAWAQRARAELAATGVAAGRAQAPGALARLTPQEYQIARLAAQGKSNREIAAQLFLSHRTVAYHLYKVYPKLGIASRTQLASLLPD